MFVLDKDSFNDTKTKIDPSTSQKDLQYAEGRDMWRIPGGLL